ncbi:Uncharacterized conserved protein YkwD, contains CAP (CSP/antigen 5/PR1) domain [Mesobacillus persicus]|uniref:Uncharacterized conserved protein YkwD, contains CAP (CSP/antigen 5/PR1) domain n=1 Tax=Mesobacillus persicus TaxID=930146 RepID=A0A1H8FHA3_9BACI|nr:CAP domain-containing protein [Mesobacillus persicus]SEN30527.1 Uncharacterized conserved protein YkwD, contains CAP (CSP/antigen 5/PR1) domain [Mesobacillus persicus]
MPAESLGTLVGEDVQSLIQKLGAPARKDSSAYGYTWFIYNFDLNHYVQAGVLNNKVVTLYAIGNAVNTAPFKIGLSIDQYHKINSIQAQVPINIKDNSYQFELTEEDILYRPLINVGDIHAQLYIDRFTGNLSSVRFIDGETLVKHQPYEMIYRGEIIKPQEIQDSEWRKIEVGAELQILDITNVIRTRHKRVRLHWDESTAEVAYAHSKEMKEANYFAHISEKYGSLSDRLDAGNVFYQLAGENIAAHYTDAPAVVEGWLNSKGHRESLLNVEFTHLGVGVYNKYYTQNFIK